MQCARSAQNAGSPDVFARQLETFLEKCEVNASDVSKLERALNISVDVVESFAAECLQRRCAVLAEEVSIWEKEAKRLLTLNRYGHAEELTRFSVINLSMILGLAAGARIPCENIATHLDETSKWSSDIAELRRENGQEQSEGQGVEAERRPMPPLTPLGAFLGQYDRSTLPRHALSILHATARSAHASRMLVRRGANRAISRISIASDLVVWGFLQDRLLVRVSGHLQGDSTKWERCDRRVPLLAASVFGQFLRCGQEAREASFSCIDRFAEALLTARCQGDAEFRATLCGLLHQAVFDSRCEERMVMRLQREA